MTAPMETLLIDDDKMTLFIHEKILSTCECLQPYKSFTSGAQALEYITARENHSKKFMLLLDINMPEMTGWDLLDRLKASGFGGNASVIMLTSSVDTEDQIKARTYDCVADFMIKPLRVSNCEEIIKIPEIVELISS
jgi:CheY-like chemotaxis protein